MRTVTRLVQLAPFVYLFFYGVYLVTEHFLDSEFPYFIDSALYVNPFSVVLMLLLGRVLKLCVWFKTACLVPMLSRIEGYVDCFIIQFTENETIIINTAIGIAALCFLILAFRHFFCDARR